MLLDVVGSVSAVMNMLGNLGGALAATVVTYTATRYRWNVPFLLTAALCLIAAVMWLKIDATRKAGVSPPPHRIFRLYSA